MIVLNPDAKPADETLTLPTAVHLRPTVSHPPTDPELPAYDTLSVHDEPKRRRRFTRARIKRLVKIAIFSGLVYLVITVIAIEITKKKNKVADNDDGPQSMNRHDVNHHERTSDPPYPPIIVPEEEGSRIACNSWAEKNSSSELRLSYALPSNTSSMFIRSIGGVPIGGSLIVLTDMNVDNITMDVIYHSSVLRPKDLVDVCLMRKGESVGLGIYTTDMIFIKGMRPSTFSLVLRIPDDPESALPVALGDFNTVLPFFTQTFLDLKGKVTFRDVDLSGIGTDVFTTQPLQSRKFTVESKPVPRTFGGKPRRRWARTAPRLFRRSKPLKTRPRR